MASDENEEFEVLDLTSIDRNWINRVFGDLSRQSVAKQVAIGGASGWVSGYLFVKVGKAAAASLGATILILQIAQHKGYIKINWNRLNSEMETARREIERRARRNYGGVIQNIFLRNNVFVAGGFFVFLICAIKKVIKLGSEEKYCIF
ncbi:hypothetical protein KUTeg_011969 [Tegillarca granosa]|uniref:FUN14 domain-containing protein 1 n=1 Tax=Tegillarca granosa TaxID=220873 RepID=A0ABQ9EY66_TEGGR|nr:hypothetical protein KUTeg_011969 [Tegillarca granosa]